MKRVVPLPRTSTVAGNGQPIRTTADCSRIPYYQQRGMFLVFTRANGRKNSMRPLSNWVALFRFLHKWGLCQLTWLQEINANNMDTEILSQMWSNYTRNVLFNLEDTNSLQKPVWRVWGVYRRMKVFWDSIHEHRIWSADNMEWYNLLFYLVAS